MESAEIKELLEKELTLTELKVSGDGSHFEVIAVSDHFAEMSRVKRQQTIYGPLSHFIADNTIHALSIKTFTEAEWAQQQKFGNLG